MKEKVDYAGYHIDVGYKFAKLGSGVFHELVSRAEANMHKDKAEYYKKNDWRR